MYFNIATTRIQRMSDYRGRPIIGDSDFRRQFSDAWNKYLSEDKSLLPSDYRHVWLSVDISRLLDPSYMTPRTMISVHRLGQVLSGDQILNLWDLSFYFEILVESPVSNIVVDTVSKHTRYLVDDNLRGAIERLCSKSLYLFSSA